MIFIFVNSPKQKQNRKININLNKELLGNSYGKMILVSCLSVDWIDKVAKWERNANSIKAPVFRYCTNINQSVIEPSVFLLALLKTTLQPKQRENQQFREESEFQFPDSHHFPFFPFHSAWNPLMLPPPRKSSAVFTWVHWLYILALSPALTLLWLTEEHPKMLLLFNFFLLFFAFSSQTKSFNPTHNNKIT